MSRSARVRLDADLALEIELGCPQVVLAGMDEVGRGALAGPVCVGAVVVVDAFRPVPPGLTDSKLLAPAVRARMSDEVKQWADAWGIGLASAREIDAVGLIGALRLAGERALEEIESAFGAVELVLLDGNHNWLAPPQDEGMLHLFDEPTPRRVVTHVKADISCATVAGASVIAKCFRDNLMVELAAQHPGYAWESNKGYGSAAHREAIERLGISPIHRRSWRL